jgi:hypothetical protein
MIEDKNRIMILGPKADGTYGHRIQDSNGRDAGDLGAARCADALG